MAGKRKPTKGYQFGGDVVGSTPTGVGGRHVSHRYPAMRAKPGTGMPRALRIRPMGFSLRDYKKGGVIEDR